MNPASPCTQPTGASGRSRWRSHSGWLPPLPGKSSCCGQRPISTTGAWRKNWASTPKYGMMLGQQNVALLSFHVTESWSWNLWYFTGTRFRSLIPRFLGYETTAKPMAPSRNIWAKSLVIPACCRGASASEIGDQCWKRWESMGIPCPRDRKHSLLAGHLAQNGVIGFCQGLQVWDVT